MSDRLENFTGDCLNDAVETLLHEDFTLNTQTSGPGQELTRAKPELYRTAQHHKMLNNSCTLTQEPAVVSGTDRHVWRWEEPGKQVGPHLSVEASS